MRRSLRGLYAVLLALLVGVPAAAANPVARADAEKRGWSPLVWITDALAAFLGRSGGSPATDDEGGGSSAEPAEDGNSEGGPDVDPAG